MCFVPKVLLKSYNKQINMVKLLFNRFNRQIITALIHKASSVSTRGLCRSSPCLHKTAPYKNLYEQLSQ